jgi:hypothetical protein
MTPSATQPQRPAVSTPYRMLAGLMFSAVCVVILLMPWVIWRRGTPVAVLHGLVVLPGVLWMAHRSWYAARRAAVSPHPYWPFASPRVGYVYTGIVVLISLFAAQLNR